MLQDDAKLIMEQGWKAREELKFEKSEKLLLQAKKMFEKQRDWFNVTECLNHMAYLRKLQAVHLSIEAYKFAQEAYSLADNHKLKKQFVLRALLSSSSVVGNYEAGLIYTKQALEVFKDAPSRSDMYSHLSTFYLRTGNLVEAESALKKAEELFDESTPEPHKSVWKSRLLMARALLFMDLGKLDAAHKLLLEALKIAEENKRKTREVEIKLMISTLLLMKEPDLLEGF